MLTRNSPYAAGVFAALALAWFAGWGLAACATLGMPAPRDFNDRVSYAYDLATQAAETVRVMAAAGELEPERGDAILERVAVYKSGIDAARAVYGVDQAEAEQRLEAIRVAIGVLLEELQEWRDNDG